MKTFVAFIWDKVSELVELFCCRRIELTVDPSRRQMQLMHDPDIIVRAMPNWQPAPDTPNVKGRAAPYNSKTKALPDNQGGTTIYNH